MGDSVQLQLAGETVELLGERALYRPAHRALLIADLHLGKADVFRRAGIGLPAGGTAHDLERLDALLAHRDVQALWILGDLLHGPAPRAAWHRRWSAWREQHCALRVIAIRGNHDRALAGADLHIEAAGEQVEDGPFVLRHDPLPHPTRHVLCGHLHPLAKLPGVSRRWPVFWLRERVTILPAFSQFTAGIVPSCAKASAWLPAWKAMRWHYRYVSQRRERTGRRRDPERLKPVASAVSWLRTAQRNRSVRVGHADSEHRQRLPGRRASVCRALYATASVLSSATRTTGCDKASTNSGANANLPNQPCWVPLSTRSMCPRPPGTRPIGRSSTSRPWAQRSRSDWNNGVSQRLQR